MSNTDSQQLFIFLSASDRNFVLQHLIQPLHSFNMTLTIQPVYVKIYGTRGQSNLTKSAIPRLEVTPGGRNLYH